MVLRGRGQIFCDDSTKAFVIKSVTMGEEVSNIVQNCVISFTDDPSGLESPETLLLRRVALRLCFFCNPSFNIKFQACFSSPKKC